MEFFTYRGMELLIPVIVYSHSRLILGFGFLMSALLLVFGKDRNRWGVLFLSLVLSLHAMHTGGSPAFQPTTTPSSLHGRVVSSPTRKPNRKLSYQLLLDSYGDEEGNVYSASGKVTVYSVLSDVDYGDTVTVHGNNQSAYFYAVSTELHDRSPLGVLRRKTLPLLLSRMPEGVAGNMVALLLLGSSLDGSKDITDSARSLGLSYLFALSGMHLGLLSLLLSRPLEWLGGKRMGGSFTLLLLTLFVYLNGWKPSLLRALLFLYFARHFDGGVALLLSFLTMWVLQPEVMLDIGTVLSFLSLAGILLFSERIRKTLVFFLPFLPRLLALLSVSLGALFFTVPFLSEAFGEWNPMSVFFGIPGGFLLTMLFFASISSIIIPKTDFILTILCELFDGLIKMGDCFTPLSGLSLWYQGVAFVLCASGFSFLLERWEKIKAWIRLTQARLKFLFS